MIISDLCVCIHLCVQGSLSRRAQARDLKQELKWELKQELKRKLKWELKWEFKRDHTEHTHESAEEGKHLEGIHLEEEEEELCPIGACL